MKKLLILGVAILLFLCDKPVQAQQDAQWSMYMWNGLVFNPAYAGSRDALSLTAIYRHQWTGFEGAPKTGAFSAHAPLLNDRIALGGYIASDNLGVTNILTFTFSYAYRIPFKNGGKLSVGMNATINNFRNRLTEITAVNPGDNAFSENETAVQPNFGFGAYYYDDNWFIGASVPHLLNTGLNESLSLEGTSDVARQFKHYFFTTGFVVSLDEDGDFKLKPSTMIKFVQSAKLSADVNLSLLIKEALWIGASYRSESKGAMYGMFEYLFVKHFRLGYAFGYPFHELGEFTSGSHEIMLGYELGKKDKYLTPRRMNYF